MSQTQFVLPLAPEVAITTVLLVDFENVREFPLALVPRDWEVVVFVGRSQNSIPFDFATRAQRLGSRLRWIKIEGDGRNNLDFHLTYYLGVLSTGRRDLEYLVLTRDKGFDALIRHLTAKGLRCKRIETLPGTESPERAAPDENFEKVLKVLSGTEERARPRRRKTLRACVVAILQNKQPFEEVERIVDALLARQLVSESDDALTYNL